MNKILLSVLCGVTLLVTLTVLSVPNRWFGIYLNNNVNYVSQKIDDATNYDTLKRVEDSCRAMISSYESDKSAYYQYKDSDNKDEHSWAEQAKMRANRTAYTYNNYVLKNSYVWNGNVPDDIKENLKVVK